ncbi:MAG: SGNH/GDSL hydrolase family protein [Chloroflexota bacterium]
MQLRRRHLLLALPALLVGGLVAARPRAEAAPPEPRPLTYVAIGASDTAGVGATVPDRESWPAVLQSRLPAGSRLVNLGVSGTLLQQALDQELPVALDANPDLVTVWLAVNDYGAGVPLERYSAQLDTLLGALQTQTHALVLVGNIPPLDALPAAARFDLKAVGAWNAAIADSVQRHGATLVDLSSSWSEVRDHPEYISSDGFHPSTLGYRRLAEIFYASAAPALALPT